MINHDELLTPGLRVRVLARLRRHSLGRALSDGADPIDSPLLAARASQLNSAPTRDRLAGGLERLARSSEAPRRAQVLPARAAARRNRSLLLELAQMLRQAGPLYARGIALLELTVTDGTGPAYTDRQGEALARRLRLARAGLVG
jgi:hypothetical protein